jgi:hypothetical protein
VNVHHCIQQVQIHHAVCDGSDGDVHLTSVDHHDDDVCVDGNVDDGDVHLTSDVYHHDDGDGDVYRNQ